MSRNFLAIGIHSTLLTFSIMGMANPALAEKNNFRVYNRSNSNIIELYVSASGHDKWGNDVLGNDILSSGNNTQIRFGDPSSYQCLYDIRAIFADRSEVEDYRINVCQSSGYEFYNR